LTPPPALTIILPTRNRPASLREAVEGLARQDIGPAVYEVVVVDDGSTPPVDLPAVPGALATTIVRLEGVERSAARNQGASRARGGILLFLDDDMTVRADFVRRHLEGQREWPGALVVGGIVLPDAMLTRPFGRFRRSLENAGLPQARGLVAARNFCAAGNMSIPAATFRALGGFDPLLSSSEDQDLALRHTAAGGRIAYLPEAVAVHRDSANEIRSYCRRTEWGSESMLPFCRRYPDWPDNVERARVNGPARFGGEPLSLSLKKLAKSALGQPPLPAILFTVAKAVERCWPHAGLLDRLYRLLLGTHIFRGYRRGLRRGEPGRG